MWDHTTGVTGRTDLGFEFACEGREVDIYVGIGNESIIWWSLYKFLLFYYGQRNVTLKIRDI